MSSKAKPRPDALDSAACRGSLEHRIDGNEERPAPAISILLTSGGGTTIAPRPRKIGHLD